MLIAGVAWWLSGSDIRFVIKRSQVRLSAGFGQAVNIHVPLLQEYNLIPA